MGQDEITVLKLAKMDDDWDDDDSYDTSDDLIVCPACGAEIFAEAEQCPACRHWLTREEGDEREMVWSKRGPSRMMKVFALVALGLILLMFIAFVWVSVTGG